MQKNTRGYNCKTYNNENAYSFNPVAILIFKAAFACWLILSVYVAWQLEIKPTVLIIKSAGCSHLRQIGITAQIHESGESCRVEVPYRANLIGADGIICLDEKQISLADNQIVAVAPLEDQPWSPSQQRWLAGLSISFMIVFFLMVLIFII